MDLLSCRTSGEPWLWILRNRFEHILASTNYSWSKRAHNLCSCEAGLPGTRISLLSHPICLSARRRGGLGQIPGERLAGRKKGERTSGYPHLAQTGFLLETVACHVGITCPFNPSKETPRLLDHCFLTKPPNGK